MKSVLVDNNKKEKPHINLSVVRCEPNVWNDLNFSKHHYLTESLNKSCKCLMFMWDGVPVAFVGLLNSPGKGKQWAISVSRIVILPDYQGLGLSMKILNFCGGIVKSLGDKYNLYIKTIHEKMGNGLERSKTWKPTSYNGKIRKNMDYELGKYNNRLERKSYCFKYEGETIHGYENLLQPINDLRKIKKENNVGKFRQLELFM